MNTQINLDSKTAIKTGRWMEANGYEYAGYRIVGSVVFTQYQEIDGDAIVELVVTL